MWTLARLRKLLGKESTGDEASPVSWWRVPSEIASAEVLRRVRRMELRTRRLVDSHFTGSYRSLFKGQGMEFAEVREYQAGDEVRTIDWNVTARMGRPFVKRYVEERELTVMMAIDVSASSLWGTRSQFKSDIATEIAGVLGLAASRSNDRVGMMLFSDCVEQFLPARKGRKHVLRMMRDLIMVRPSGRGTSFEALVDPLLRALPHRSVIFIFSDFIADDFETPLARLAQRHDVVAVTLEDPVEEQLPDIGPVRFEDPETGATVAVDTSDRKLRQFFASEVQVAKAHRQNVFSRLAIDVIRASTEDGYVDSLVSFFRARSRRAHGAQRSSSHYRDLVSTGTAPGA